MKISGLFFTAFILICRAGVCQSDFTELLNQGKNAFYSQNFDEAAKILENAVQLNPKHPEAFYFLGYAYSRLNSSDGKTLIETSLPLVLKSSEAFEKVIKISPKYTGEVIVLDPYSKITSEWSSMAMAYLYKDKNDSALWCYKEGKKRGGFGDFFIELAKFRLDQCKPNSILISSGDNSTFPLWYAQNFLNYRKDVAVIDAGLINTSWYTKYLTKTKTVEFDLPDAVLDTIEYRYWQDSVVTIRDFQWTVKPSYMENYVLRGDLVLLSLLRQNLFKRDFYFTSAFPEESMLNLKYRTQPLVEVDKIFTGNETLSDYQKYKTDITRLLAITAKANKNSRQELLMVDNFRYGILKMLLSMDDKKQRTELLQLMDKFIPENDYPYQGTEGKKYADQVREYIGE